MLLSSTYYFKAPSVVVLSGLIRDWYVPIDNKPSQNQIGDQQRRGEKVNGSGCMQLVRQNVILGVIGRLSRVIVERISDLFTAILSLLTMMILESD